MFSDNSNHYLESLLVQVFEMNKITNISIRDKNGFHSLICWENLGVFSN